MRKFVRRHRVLVTSTVALLVMLAGFGASMAYQQAQTARALRRAEAETAKARDVTRFLVGMFREADPFQQATAMDGSPGAETALDAAAKRIETELAGQPDVRGELLATLGVIQRNLGRYRQSEDLLRRAIDERRRILGAATGSDRDLARLYHELGITLRFGTSYDSSRVWLDRALAMRREMLPASDPEIAATMGELGSVMRYLGRSADARRMFTDVARIQEANGDSLDLAVTLDRFSVVAVEAGDIVRGESLVRRSLAIQERLLGSDHPLVAQAFSRLAWVVATSDPDAAERAARRALDIQRRRLGSAHPSTLTTLSALSLNARARGDLVTAEQLQREVLDGRRKVLGPVHRDVAGSLANLAATFEQRGDLAGADTLFSQSLAMYRQVGGADPDAWPLALHVATIKRTLGDERSAMRLAREIASLPIVTVRVWGGVLGDELAALALLLATRGDCDGARALGERVDAVRRWENPTYTAPNGGPALGACRER